MAEGAIVLYRDPIEAGVIWARMDAITLDAAGNGGWTTIFKVANLDLSEDEFLKLFARSGGWEDYEEEDMQGVSGTMPA